jgi:murein DD-endopeptidase MepM/ murein hydrolase activator NlpD
MTARARAAVLAVATIALLAVPAHGASAYPHFPVRGAVDYGDAEAAFGSARGRMHEGQDIFAPPGSPLLAVRAAVVLEAGSDGGRGNYVSLYSAAADQTYNYFHMEGPAEVGIGERVRGGQPVGRLGCTGSCWGNHLHFELRLGRDPYGAAIDPLPLLERIRTAARWRWLPAGAAS